MITASKEFLATFDPVDKRYHSFDFYHSMGLEESKYHYHLTKESFRQAIMDERKWELGFEYQRRWD